MLPPIAMSIGTAEQFEEQRIDLVRDQVDALGGMGFPEIQIRKTLSKYVLVRLTDSTAAQTLKFCKTSAHIVRRFSG
jgi:hypothetical protein